MLDKEDKEPVRREKSATGSNRLTRVWILIRITGVKGYEVVAAIITAAALPFLIFWATNYLSEQKYYGELLEKYINSMEEMLVDNKLHTLYQDKESIQKDRDNIDKAIEELKTDIKKRGIVDQVRYEKYVHLLDEKTKYFDWVMKLKKELPPPQTLNETEIFVDYLTDKRDEKDTELVKKTFEYTQVKSLALSLTENSLRLLSQNDTFFNLPIPRLPFLSHNFNRRELLLNYLKQSNLGFISKKDGKKPLSPSNSFLENINLGLIATKFNNISLEGIDLSLAILQHANFKAADLTHANLTQADLSSTLLEKAILNNAILVKANLRNARLSEAKIKGTCLDKANLIGADLNRVEFDDKTQLRGAIYNENTKFSDKSIDKDEQGMIEIKPNFNLKNLPEKVKNRLIELEEYETNSLQLVEETVIPKALARTELSKLDLTGARLIEADLTETELIGANLTKANLKQANLTKANLTQANLTGAKLKQANLTKANLTKANLTQANLIWADLIGANLKEANLTKAKLIGANLIGVNFTGATLTGANLVGANLIEKTDLTKVNLIGADLRGANLKEANLNGAKLDNIFYNETTIFPEEFDLNKHKNMVYKD